MGTSLYVAGGDVWLAVKDGLTDGEVGRVLVTDKALVVLGRHKVLFVELQGP